MEIIIVAVGTLKEKFWKSAAEEYQKRLSRFCKLRIVEIGESKLPASSSEANVCQALEAEGGKILAASQGYTRIGLFVEGKPLTSKAFASALENWAMEGRGKLAFLIGGSHGMSPAVKKQCDLHLSFSAMTFPHQLMRILLLEQIYRAFKINANEIYHK